MQITKYTDYSLRVLMYVARKKEERTTITELSEFYGISRNHLGKVVHNLVKKSYLNSTRGRDGGLFLAKEADKINIGSLIKELEPNFNLVECFDKTNNTCPINSSCSFKPILNQALFAFFETLSKYTLAETIKNKKG